MSMKRNILSLLLAICMIAALFAARTKLPVAAAAETGQTIQVDGGSKTSFLEALNKARDGDTLYLNGIIVSNAPKNGDDPIVIDKAVTITGSPDSQLSIRAGGIVLEADVTFKNTMLSFPNMLRNVIIANGHTLTMDNVTINELAGRRYIALFCGSLVGATDYANQNTGNHGRIILKNGGPFKYIFAGNYYDNPNGRYQYNGDANQPCDIPADITVEANCGVDSIWAGGAWMERAPLMTDTPSPVYTPIHPDEQCVVNAPVSIRLEHKDAVRVVYGATGGSGQTSLTYAGVPGETNRHLIMTNIASLTVERGNLSPSAGSSFDGPGAVTLYDGVALGLGNLGNLTLGSLDLKGNNTLILDTDQTVTVNSVTGTARVALGGVSPDGLNSLYTPPYGFDHTCIQAIGAGPDAFTLLPPSDQTVPLPGFTYSNGAFSTVTIAPPAGKVSRFSMSSVEVYQDTSVDISVDAEFVIDGNAPIAYYMYEIPAEISVTHNGQVLQVSAPVAGSAPYDYTMNLNGSEFTLMFQPYGALAIYAADDTAQLPVGDYKITVTIPSDSTERGVEISETASVKVVDTPITIADPGVRELIYTGQTQHGIVPHSGYDLSYDDSCVKPGEYTAGVTLKPGYRWWDGSTGEKQITWRVVPPAGEAIPAGALEGAPPTQNGAEDAKIRHTTARMEWAVSGSDAWASCEDGMTVVKNPGTYLVRMKAEQDNGIVVRGAGPVTTIVIQEPARPSVTGISMQALPNKIEYTVGDALDVAGAMLAVRVSNGGSYLVPLEYANDPNVQQDERPQVSGFNSTREGEQTITVIYQGCSTTFQITVAEPSSTPSPSPSPEPAPTPSQEPTPTPTPSQGPAPTPTPSQEPTPTPTPSQGPAPTPTPSQGPAPTPTPSQGPAPTPTPSQGPAPTPAPSQGPAPTPAPTPRPVPMPGSSSGSVDGMAFAVQAASPAVSTGNAYHGGAAVTTTTARPAASTRDGAASAQVYAIAGSELLRQAKEHNSQTVVIAPEMGGGVTKAEVSIPASTVGALGRETGAALTVSTPVADVAIPNGALGNLGTGGSVTVTAERAGSTVTLTVAANHKTVSELPGGVTLTAPWPAARASTVAVLVKEDGGRTVIRESLAAGGTLTIPLKGSATVEIVDNQRTFRDMHTSAWALDAVSFVSSRGILNGTGADTFSPTSAMTRGMLAMALHNLEYNPTVRGVNSFSDVSNSAWYAGAVRWAADEGIITGYGDGTFGAKDPITREQLAVILWRYHGSPSAGAQNGLDFADAHMVSGYSREAVNWAVARGIFRGKGNGLLDPQGGATRAEVAQMLKNYLENR